MKKRRNIENPTKHWKVIRKKDQIPISLNLEIEPWKRKVNSLTQKPDNFAPYWLLKCSISFRRMQHVSNVLT